MDVQAFIPGYVSLLQSSDRGRGLSQAADALSPVLEIGPQLRSERQFLAGLSAAGLLGTLNFPSIIVPDGEIWHVLWVEATLAVSASFDQNVVGWTVDLWPVCENSAAGVNPKVALTVARDVDVSTLAAGTVVKISGPVDVWCRPGSQLIPGGVTAGTGPNVTSSVTALVERFRL